MPTTSRERTRGFELYHPAPLRERRLERVPDRVQVRFLTSAASEKQEAGTTFALSRWQLPKEDGAGPPYHFGGEQNKKLFIRSVVCNVRVFSGN